MAFASLGLSPHLCQAAERAGWLQPTPIQEQGIPPILQGKDCKYRIQSEESRVLW